MTSPVAASLGSVQSNAPNVPNGSKRNHSNDITGAIAGALGIAAGSVSAALALFDEQATVPFVARYRKERTGGLDEVQLRAIEEHRRRILDIADRRTTILKAMREQGALNPGLERRLWDCATLAALEDIYAPFKSRRKTRADKAREAGLGPLAEMIWSQPRNGDVSRDARRFVGQTVATLADALAGARDIVAERLALDSERRAWIREMFRRHGKVQTKLDPKHADAGQFRDYDGFAESASHIPSHRYLAACRGETLGALKVKLRPDMDQTLQQMMRGVRYFPASPYGPELAKAAEDAFKRLLVPVAERAVRADLKGAADKEAIDVFARNLEAVLLSAPLGPVSVLGVDPGIRTGCKWAHVSANGALVAHGVVSVRGSNGGDTGDWTSLLRRLKVEAVAVGNGTGGREAETSIRAAAKALNSEVLVVSVNEAGASIYSASELAGRELGEVDLTVRGAVSIGRRLQDPLSEWVKVPPKSIGVGQYQHDVDQGWLAKRLSDVVETCVNRVGVEVATASPALLGYVAGLGPKTAEAIVERRQSRDGIRSRRDLLKVAGLGPKTYEQCAGFLRVSESTNPLDRSAVHPERYKLVAQMARDLGASLESLVGRPERVADLNVERYLSDDVGSATLKDIVDELGRPGRDPRDAFEAPAFHDDVHSIDDLEVGMTLEGAVTNVTNFGAFVDIGVHQDGLVHVSKLADRFIRSPHEAVVNGQRIKVKVLEIDRDRRRISLTAKPSEVG